MKVLGSMGHLQFEWSGTEEEAQAHPPEPPPIVGYLRRHPWHLARLLSRNVPGARKESVSQAPLYLRIPVGGVR
jgi:hypothetical protein